MHWNLEETAAENLEETQQKHSWETLFCILAGKTLANQT